MTESRAIAIGYNNVTSKGNTVTDSKTDQPVFSIGLPEVGGQLFSMDGESLWWRTRSGRVICVAEKDSGDGPPSEKSP